MNENLEKLNEGFELDRRDSDTLNDANKFVALYSAERCDSLIEDMKADCDTLAMRLWKTLEDFTEEDLGRLIQLKSMRTYLCNLSQRYEHSKKMWNVSEKEIKKVQEYLNKY